MLITITFHKIFTYIDLLFVFVHRYTSAWSTHWNDLHSVKIEHF